MAAVSKPTGRNPLRVVIAGGGVAGLEAALALHDLAGERVHVELLAPDGQFVYRPQAVLEPFGDTGAERFAIGDVLAETATTVRPDSLAWVDRSSRVVHTPADEVVAYDVLVLCPGADARVRHQHAITIGGSRGGDGLRRMIEDVDAGRTRHLAFVVPAAGSWQLPLVELALQTAARAHARELDVEISLFTPEATPLEAFGEPAGSAAQRLLTDRGIEVVCGVACRVPDPHTVIVVGHRGPERSPAGGAGGAVTRTFDAIVALPELHGPHLRGVPTVRDGFIPVDVHCRVRGAEWIFAAGDATDCPVKHGGVAAQQADTVARSVAALSGAPVAATPFRSVIRGLLETGEDPVRVTANVIGGHGFRSRLEAAPAGSAPAKIDAEHLGPALARLRLARQPA